MKKVLFTGLFLFSSIFGNQKNDQLHIVFGGSGYILYKAIDFAYDHGFPYIKILSYEFRGFEHTFSGKSEVGRSQGGKYFELKDDYCDISLLCFDEAPQDFAIIRVENYSSLLERLHQ